jgi:hypothetical protein
MVMTTPLLVFALLYNSPVINKQRDYTLGRFAPQAGTLQHVTLGSLTRSQQHRLAEAAQFQSLIEQRAAWSLNSCPTDEILLE